LNDDKVGGAPVGVEVPWFHGTLRKGRRNRIVDETEGEGVWTEIELGARGKA